MQLYYSPGACALAIHAMLNDMGVDYALVKVDLKTHTTEQGQNFFDINPKGYVPVLELDQGERITELPAVAQYLAENVAASALFPAGGMAKIRVIEWLSYIGAEVHKAYAPLFNPQSSDEMIKTAIDLIGKRYAYIDTVLASQPFVTGKDLSVADFYVFVTLTWADKHGIDLTPWPGLLRLKQQVGNYPAMRSSMQQQGLI